MTPDTTPLCPDCESRLVNMTCSRCKKTWRVVKRLVDVMEEATEAESVTPDAKLMEEAKIDLVGEAMRLAKELAYQKPNVPGGLSQDFYYAYECGGRDAFAMASAAVSDFARMLSAALSASAAREKA